MGVERLKLDFKFGVHVDRSKSQPTDYKFEQEVVCTLSNGYVAVDLG